MRSKGMKRYRHSEALFEAGRKVLAGGTSSNFRYGGTPVPLYYDRGSGPYLYDADGNRTIDYALGNGPVILGHAPAPVLSAVTETLDRGQLFAGQHPLEIELAERVVSMVPAAELVRFSSSGSEAIEAALRLARAFTGRSKFIKFEGHYHGWFDDIFLSVRPPVEGKSREEASRAHPETPGQSPSALDNAIVLPWNDPASLAETLESRGKEVAAVLMEPMMCNTGVIPPNDGYLETVRRLCSEHGCLLVFDEVITGFRLGPGGAQGRFGVTPDLAVFAKAMGGGFPISAVAGRRDIMELVATRQVMHGGTYNSNVVSVAASLATLEALAAEEGQAYRDMASRGERLMAGLREVSARHGMAMLVQGEGTVFHPAFTNRNRIEDYRGFLDADAARQKAFVAALQEEGVRVSTRGTWFLSTAHGDEDIEATLDAADRAMARL